MSTPDTSNTQSDAVTQSAAGTEPVARQGGKAANALEKHKERARQRIDARSANQVVERMRSAVARARQGRDQS